MLLYNKNNSYDLEDRYYCTSSEARTVTICLRIIQHTFTFCTIPNSSLWSSSRNWKWPQHLFSACWQGELKLHIWSSHFESNHIPQCSKKKKKDYAMYFYTTFIPLKSIMKIIFLPLQSSGLVSEVIGYTHAGAARAYKTSWLTDHRVTRSSPWTLAESVSTPVSSQSILWRNRSCIICIYYNDAHRWYINEYDNALWGLQ